MRSCWSATMGKLVRHGLWITSVIHTEIHVIKVHRLHVSEAWLWYLSRNVNNSHVWSIANSTPLLKDTSCLLLLTSVSLHWCLLFLLLFFNVIFTFAFYVYQKTHKFLLGVILSSNPTVTISDVLAECLKWHTMLWHMQESM